MGDWVLRGCGGLAKYQSLITLYALFSVSLLYFSAYITIKLIFHNTLQMVFFGQVILLNSLTKFSLAFSQ